MSKDVTKDAFIIMRVEKNFKTKLLAKAKKLGKDLRKMLREVIEQWQKQS